MSGLLWKYEINTAISGYESYMSHIITPHLSVNVCNTHMKQMKNKCVRDVLSSSSSSSSPPPPSSSSSSSSSSFFIIYIYSFFANIAWSHDSLLNGVLAWWLLFDHFSVRKAPQSHPSGPLRDCETVLKLMESLTRRCHLRPQESINQQLQRQPVHQLIHQRNMHLQCICNASFRICRFTVGFTRPRLSECPWANLRHRIPAAEPPWSAMTFHWVHDSYPILPLKQLQKDMQKPLAKHAITCNNYSQNIWEWCKGCFCKPSISCDLCILPTETAQFCLFCLSRWNVPTSDNLTTWILNGQWLIPHALGQSANPLALQFRWKTSKQSLVNTCTY